MTNEVRPPGDWTAARPGRAVSYLDDGRQVVWHAPAAAARAACDAERLSAPLPQALAGRYGAEDFHLRWTRTETLAKLAAVPVLEWLRRHGLDGRLEGARLTTILLPGEDVVVTLGFLP